MGGVVPALGSPGDGLDCAHLRRAPTRPAPVEVEIMRPRLLSILSVAAALVSLTLSADGRSQTGQVPLPDGPGKDLATVTCGECHGLNKIRNSWGYSPEGWQELFFSMVAMPDKAAPPAHVH